MRIPFFGDVAENSMRLCRASQTVREFNRALDVYFLALESGVPRDILLVCLMSGFVQHFRHNSLSNEVVFPAGDYGENQGFPDGWRSDFGFGFNRVRRGALRTLALGIRSRMV